MIYPGWCVRTATKNGLAHPSRVYSPGASARAAVAAQYSLHLVNRLHAASLGHCLPDRLAAGALALLFPDDSDDSALLLLSRRTPLPTTLLV